MGEWLSSGVVEYWSVGVVEWWSIGVVEYWSGGVVELIYKLSIIVRLLKSH